MLELRSLLIEHADVWQRACAGEELDSLESTQAAQLFRAYVEFTWTQGVTSELGMFNYAPVIAGRYAANLHRYPGFARMAEAHNEWNRDSEQGSMHVEELGEFRDLMLTRLATLQKLEPNPNFDVSLCGM